jgi:hypothetical protein
VDDKNAAPGKQKKRERQDTLEGRENRTKPVYYHPTHITTTSLNNDLDDEYHQTVPQSNEKPLSAQT